MKSGPTIILGTLISTLILSMAAIALIILFNQNRPTSEELATACQSEVGAAISSEYDKVIKACEEAQENAVNTIQGSARHPGFSYPSSWTAVGNFSRTNTELSQTIHITPGFLNYCEACDGPYIPVLITSFPKTSISVTDIASLKTYIDTQYKDDFHTNVQVTDSKIGNADVVIVTGHLSGMYEIDFEHVYYLGSTSVVRIDADASNEYKNGWSVIKSSLDFSDVE